MLTMIVNVISSPFLNLFWYLMFKFWQCKDRSWSLDRTKTKKKYQDDWNTVLTAFFWLYFKLNTIINNIIDIIKSKRPNVIEAFLFVIDPLGKVITPPSQKNLITIVY